MQPIRGPDNAPLVLGNVAPHGAVLSYGENMVMSELVDCCKELEEGYHALSAHKKEAAWRLSRVELQLEWRMLQPSETTLDPTTPGHTVHFQKPLH
ncbi:hypothetical protein RYX36_034965 [Vicia faba]